MFYDAEAQILYLPQDAVYTLDLGLLTTLEARDESGNPLPDRLQRIRPGTAQEVFRLPEGPAEFGATLSDGRRLSQQTFVDGRPPELSLRLEAASFSASDSLYYGPPQQLRFEAYDEAAGLEQIWVSVNGSSFMPHQEAVQMIQAEGAYLLEFYAVDRVGNVSEMQQKTFVLDLRPPRLEMSRQGSLFENRMSRTAAFVLEATDARAGLAHIFYRIVPEDAEGSSRPRFAIYDEETPVALQQFGEGRYRLEAFATDRVDLASDTLRYRFVIDDSPPSLRAEVGTPVFQREATRYIAAETPLRLVAEDGLSQVSQLRYGINDAPGQDYAQAFSLGRAFPDAFPGLYSISYQAADAVGNESSISVFRVFLDTKPPELSYAFEGAYTGEAEAGRYSLSPETRLLLTAEDLETGQADITYQLIEKETARPGSSPDSAAWQTYETALQFDEPGHYELRFRAADPLENSSEIQQLSLDVRETGGFASAGSGPAPQAPGKAWFRESDAEETLTGPLSEDIYLFISDSPETGGMQFLLSETPDPADGARQLSGEGRRYISFDIGTGEQLFELTADGTPPQTTLLPAGSPPAETEASPIFDTEVRFRLESRDERAGLDEIFYSIDGQAYQLYTDTLEGFVAQKEYILRYYALDKAGNKEAVQRFAFTVDATPPRSRFELLSDFSGSIVSPQTRWAIRSSDNTAGVEAVYFRFNEEPQWQRYTGAVAFSELTAGGRIRENELQQLHYYAVDKVGNKEAARQFNFRLQTRPPALSYQWQGSVVKRRDTYVAHPDTRLQLQATPENVPVRVLSYGFAPGQMQPYTGPVQLPAGEQGRVFYEAEDETGNQTGVQELRFLSDETPPRTRHEIRGRQLQVRTGLVLGPGHEIRLRAEDAGAGVAQTRLRMNEGGWQTYRDAITLGQSGSYTLSYTSADAVGNEEPLRSFSFLVDVSPPAISLIYSRPPRGESVSGALRLAPGTIIAANATDRHTELEQLQYRINDGDLQEYTGPLRALPEEETFRLSFRATDLAGNVTEETGIFMIETTR
ncbi:MAG: OmpL47-type beta-barrel domain-containing protein [Cyclonatronaceae bacterium]